MNTDICCIFNLAPHYRQAIFVLMDQKLECDFYFGDQVKGSIKLMDYNVLKGYKGMLSTKNIMNTSFEWQKGVLNLIFKPYKFYLITGHPNVLSNWPLLVIAKLLGKKVIAWSHGMKDNPDSKHKWFEKLFYRLTASVLLYGEHAKKNMISKGFDHKRLIPIYNSLDYEKHLEVRKSLKSSSIYENHFGNKLPVIIHIGRIQASKNLDFLVQAAQELTLENNPCNLVFIGEDIGDNNLVEVTKKLNFDNNVWFYGPSYDEEEIGNLLFNADVCVSPGSVGLTAIHSMSYGTPVISHNDINRQAPEHETIIDGKTGSLFELGSLEDLKTQINRWIGLDSEQRENIRKYAYSVVDEKYNPFYQIHVLEHLFQKKK